MKQYTNLNLKRRVELKTEQQYSVCGIHQCSSQTKGGRGTVPSTCLVHPSTSVMWGASTSFMLEITLSNWTFSRQNWHLFGQSLKHNFVETKWQPINFHAGLKLACMYLAHNNQMHWQCHTSHVVSFAHDLVTLISHNIMQETVSYIQFTIPNKIVSFGEGSQSTFRFLC